MVTEVEWRHQTQRVLWGSFAQYKLRFPGSNVDISRFKQTCSNVYDANNWPISSESKTRQLRLDVENNFLPDGLWGTWTTYTGSPCEVCILVVLMVEFLLRQRVAFLSPNVPHCSSSQALCLCCSLERPLLTGLAPSWRWDLFSNVVSSERPFCLMVLARLLYYLLKS